MRARAQAGNHRTERLRPARKRLKSLFGLLIDISATAEKAMLTSRSSTESVDRLAWFDMGILIRASNALKAIRLLCEESQWEFAAAPVRQVFELVLDMEYMQAQADREQAILEYEKFGLLGSVRQELSEMAYAAKSGRSIDTRRQLILKGLLKDYFEEFRQVHANGDRSWARSWTRQSASALADRSPSRLRKDQYNTLYGSWSEQAHGGPTALLPNVMPHLVDGPELVASDDVRVVETVTVSVTLFLELWQLLPNLPPPDPVKSLDWANRAMAEAQRVIALQQAGGRRPGS